ncbi:hypothetical protein SAY86_025510 [Trapa natans]|uniref:THO1-MOS11 C-terminal domain-containing protein n=1 Tax=Trapa natans TaxID=22666 RepID=A0AAN7M6H3_TRANT|nr:hypothetical protein SAY86_025510 [Trapa natans]
MAKVAFNLNERLPSEEIDFIAAGPPTDRRAVVVSEHLPPASSEIVNASEGAEESKKTVTVIGSQAVNGIAAPVNDIIRKIRRAERFGVPIHLSESEKRYSRAERFGTISDEKKPGSLKKSEELKLKARAERFGISVPETMDEEEKKKKKARLARFSSNGKTISDEEEKR